MTTKRTADTYHTLSSHLWNQQQFQILATCIFWKNNARGRKASYENRSLSPLKHISRLHWSRRTASPTPSLYSSFSTSELLRCTLHIVIRFSGLRTNLIPNQIFILHTLLKACPTIKSVSLETRPAEDIESNSWCKSRATVTPRSWRHYFSE